MSVVSEWLFNAPVLVLGPIALAAALALAYGLLRGEARVWRPALAAVAVVALWASLSYFVRTPVESAVARARGLAAAFEAGDWAGFDKLLDPETRFYSRLKGPQITEAARLTREATGATDVRVLGTRATRDGEAIAVTMRVLSQHTAVMTRTVVTLFRFDLHRRNGQWRLESIEPLPTENFDATAYLRFLVMPPSASK